MQEIMVDEKYNFSINNFDGPLDLLLHLISKNKKSIFDISLSELTDEYLKYLDEMNDKNIEIASEFVVMAATLLDIKARKLLPELEEVEEEEPLTEEEIMRRIAQYKLYKEASSCIYEIYKENLGSYVKSFEKIRLDKKIEYNGEKFTADGIFNIYSDILFRNQSKINRNAKEIEKLTIYEKYTVQDKVEQIVSYLNTNKNMVFNQVFSEQACNNIEVVTAFLGVLELGKMKQVDINQKYLFSDINISKRIGEEINIDIETLNY